MPDEEGGSEVVSSEGQPLVATTPQARRKLDSWLRTVRLHLRRKAPPAVFPKSSPVSPRLRLLGRERRNQEAFTPEIGRGSATEAGVAMMAYIHPLVKVFIFPTSSSALPRLRPKGRATCA